MINWLAKHTKIYKQLLSDYNRHEEKYWKQATHNGMWERKYNDLLKEYEGFKQKNQIQDKKI